MSKESKCSQFSRRAVSDHCISASLSFAAFITSRWFLFDTLLMCCSMASLLSKFRIDYSDLTIFSGLTKKPQEETKVFYENLVKDFVSNSTDVVAGAEESTNDLYLQGFCENRDKMILSRLS